MLPISILPTFHMPCDNTIALHTLKLIVFIFTLCGYNIKSTCSVTETFEIFKLLHRELLFLSWQTALPLDGYH